MKKNHNAKSWTFQIKINWYIFLSTSSILLKNNEWAVALLVKLLLLIISFVLFLSAPSSMNFKFSAEGHFIFIRDKYGNKIIYELNTQTHQSLLGALHYIYSCTCNIWWTTKTKRKKNKNKLHQHQRRTLFFIFQVKYK